MGIIILLIVGGLIGWVASMIMRTDAQQGILLNIVVGIVGALIAGYVVTPLVGGVPITSGVISISSILVSLLGAIVLLAIVNLARRGTVQRIGEVRATVTGAARSFEACMIHRPPLCPIG